MGISVREAMKIYPFSRAKLLGGTRGLERVVESANIQEVPHVERWLHGGEILFSAGYAFQGLTDDVVHMMERIEQVGAAALVLKPGQFLHTIPQEWVHCSDRIGLPLFELPEGLPYMDCIIPIFERLNQKQLFQLRRVESIHEQLTQSILHGGGLDGLCLTLHQATGQPVFIFDAVRGVLAQCLGDTGPSYGEALQALFRNYCQKAAPHALQPNRCNFLGLNEEHKAICVPILVQGERLAYLLLDCSSHRLPDTDLIAFEHTSSLIAIELLKDRALVEQEQKIQEKLLEDLLMKRYGDREMLLRRGLYLGIDLNKPYCVFLLDPDAFEAYISQQPGDYTEADIQQLKARIHDLIRMGMRSYSAPYLLLTNSVSVVGLVSILQDSGLEQCRSVLSRIITQLRDTYPKLGFSAGIGRIKTDLGMADESLQEARLALNCARLPQWSVKDHIACFNTLGAISFLCELSHSDAMQAFYQERLGHLLEYDREHGTELVHTLDCYFRCATNLRRTAQALYIHKNSAIYRIHKIEGLLNCSLSDSQAAFDLQLCLLLRNVL